MRIAFVAALMLTLAFSSANAQQTTRATGSDLLGDCKLAIRAIDEPFAPTPQQAADVSNCLGYLRGLGDALTMRYTGHDPLLCTDAGVTSAQFARVYVRYAEAHPERLHEDALYLVLPAMFESFGCQPPAT